jgi:serine phosphatase RsbU (regulator of sigma subunit)
MDTQSLGDILGATVGRIRLHTEARRLGAKMHEALRIDLPAIEALDLAARYLPAGDAVAAGGDFAEVTDLGDAYGVVIGDVVGHGVDAAVLSVQLRSEVATALHVTREPAAALRVLDERVRGRGEHCIATAMCLLVDPALGVATIATAGHPPPLIVSDDRTSEWLALPSGPPVGVRGERPPSTIVAFGRDEVMLCFTDGVIERPGVLLDEGVAHLAAHVLAGHHVDGHMTTADVVDAALEAALAFGERRDDAVAVALRSN